MITSDFIQGMMRLRDWKLSTKELLHQLHHLMDLGITSFDHADIYGDFSCEQIFGKALQQEPSLRKNMQVISKCGIMLEGENQVKHYNLSKNHIIQSVENSLQRLQTDYLDYLLLHRPSPIMNPAEVADAFHILHQQGKVLHFGISNFSAAQIQYLQSFLNIPLGTNQIEMSPLHLQAFQDGTLNYTHKNNMQVMAWSPMAGGKIITSEDAKALRIREAFTQLAEACKGESTESLVYAWLMHHPASIIPIIGSGKISHVKQAIKARSIQLSDEQWFRVWQASIGQNVP
jgi:predicted oxidoreductase